MLDRDLSSGFASMLRKFEAGDENFEFWNKDMRAHPDFSWGSQDGDGLTPLMVLCAVPVDANLSYYNPESTALRFLAAYAEQGVKRTIDARSDGLGVTALMIAVESGRGVLARALCKAGADVEIADCQGRTAMDRAMARRDLRLGAVLEHARAAKLERAAREKKAKELERAALEAQIAKAPAPVEIKLPNRGRG
jgi:ankyrin repeat protein